MRYEKWIFSLIMIVALFLMPMTGDTQTLTIEPQWGITHTICKSIPATTFNSINSSDGWDNLSGAWLYGTSGASSLFDANVDLPAGAKVSDIYVSASDTSEEGDVWAWFFECPTDNPMGCNDYPFDSSLRTSGSSGYSRLYKDLSDQNITVDNLNKSYLVRVLLDSGDDTNRFASVQVCYKLQISPAPGTTTFSDVPVGSFWHQYVEALAASGITTGYGDGTYRPEEYVTRGQMAAFFSRALGLYWPD